MKLPRRQFLHLAAGAAALPAVSRVARAQAYPTRPVRLLVGFAAGGPADLFARLITQWLSERLAQPFFVENKPGQGGSIAAEAVVRAPADGHTLLLVTIANAASATLFTNLSFDLVRDIAPVAGVNRGPYVMVVNPSLQIKSLPEFIGYAKANPGKINYASGGIGSLNHLCGELLKSMAGLDLVHIPYRGAGPAMIDVLAGQVLLTFDSTATATEHIKAGKLRPLAVTTATRARAMPHIPTMAEFLPGYEASGWGGIGVPRATPSEIIDKLNREINAALVDPKIEAWIADLSG